MDATGDAIGNIPELKALEGASGLIRIPDQVDVPVTPRVLRLIDTPEFRRLQKISQLGMVAFVYPGAQHDRFEHSLGVYRMALLFLRHLAHQPPFEEKVSAHDATVLILAALLHDIGHWPFCHPIEDMQLEGIPHHETFAQDYLLSDNVAACLQEDWQVDPRAVLGLIHGTDDSPAGKILGSILSGPIDIDKMDYLYRDSLHAGVPYGKNFDAARLMRSLCLNATNDRLAITHKGKTAAEMMVFARYVMFSEVYWHHAVRSATAMFQRSFYRWHQQHRQEGSFDETVNGLFRKGETDLIQALKEGGKATGLLDGLFGVRRVLYKRVASYSIVDGEAVYRKIAQQPYAWLVACSQALASELAAAIGHPIEEDQVLIDAPPVGLEVQFDIDVFDDRSVGYRRLGDVSPVVQTLAQRQFDDFVKQVRVFVDPVIAPWLDPAQVDCCLQKVVDGLGE